MNFIEVTDNTQGLKHFIKTSEIIEVEELYHSYGCMIYLKSERAIKVDQSYKYVIEQIQEKDDA